MGFRLVFLGLGFRDLAFGFGILLRVLGLVPWDLAKGFGFRVFGVGLGFLVECFGIWPRVWGLGFCLAFWV